MKSAQNASEPARMPHAQPTAPAETASQEEQPAAPTETATQEDQPTTPAKEATSRALAETATLKGHTGFVNSVSFSPDGTRIASGGRDDAIRLWDVTP